MAHKLIVGTNSKAYPQIRNVTSLPFQKYTVERIHDAFGTGNWIYHRLKGRSHPFLLNSFWDFGLNKYSVLHFVNAISYGKRPWVSTFETFIPRWGVSPRILERGLRLICQKNCAAILPMSTCAASFQEHFVRERFEQFWSEISAKMQVVHPAQTLCIDSIQEKEGGASPLVFTLVGGDFFRKGGLHVLRVFDRLIKMKADLCLNIVSRMGYGDYASRTNADDAREASVIIQSHPGEINHIPALPNSGVLDLFKKSHVCLLPTLGETYGYSVLEAQACGCPVVTTNIRALPEINNDEVGWIIPIPKDGFGNAILTSVQDREEVGLIIERELEKIVTGLLNNPVEIAGKGELSLRRISHEHSPESRALIIETIYNQALAS
jgi:glycosyltransferase involved in cell wall biosynthesis